MYADAGRAALLSLIPSFLLLHRRAATLVRKMKGENKMGRSHPLRCGRQRWYGGNQGIGDTGGRGRVGGGCRRRLPFAPPPRSEPQQDMTLGTPPPPPTPNTTNNTSHNHSLFAKWCPSHSSCSGGLTCACLCWTQQSDQWNELNCMTGVQREGPAKDNKMIKT